MKFVCAIRKTTDTIFSLLIYYALCGKICLTIFFFRFGGGAGWEGIKNRETDINSLLLFREQEIMKKNCHGYIGFPALKKGIRRIKPHTEGENCYKRKFD
jgi:hypothetical protein